MSEFDLLVTSGAGPVEVRRFVLQLAGRLERLAHERGVDLLDLALHGDAAAPRSATLHLRGDGGQLAGECGTHVLIQRSPERGRSSRKRWFASVSLHEALPCPAGPPAIARGDLVVTACRAGGPGGQHVNKVSTAVRAVHIPSGLSVRSAGARSQSANLEQALRRLAALLHQQAQASRAAGRSARRGAHYRAERGRPIRTYVVDGGGHLLERILSP